MRPFTDRVALVTGASSGIGAALARELARQGAAVVLFARREERLQEVAATIGREGGRAIAVTGDVTRRADLDRAVAAGREAFGQLDVVVANAGFGVSGVFEALSVDDYRRQFETNVFGVLHTIYAALEDLKATRGTLAIVGSVVGHIAPPGNSPYTMSKFAVRALADALRPELAPHGVAVVQITPGFVASEIRLHDREGRPKASAREPVPTWLVMPAEQAARRIARAIARRRRQLVLTVHGKLALFLDRFAPWLLRPLLARRRLRRPSDR
jgi:NADP-dependent 3-hydroxy acid dehydrogenase YdfG